MAPLTAIDEQCLEIQRLYPQIYHACHARHPRSRRRNGFAVSERDQALLAHLSPREGLRPAALARHLGIGLPTLSEAVQRLERQGYLRREPAPGDRRARTLWLTARGAEALRGTSVLDDGRLGRLLARLTRAERTAAVEGLALLARAAGELAALEARR